MSKSPSSRNRQQGMLTAANLNRRGDQYGITDDTQGKNVSYGDVQTDSSNRYPVKPAGKYKHNFENQFGPEEGARATTTYPGSHWTSKEERDSHIEGINPSNPYNVQYLNANRKLPNEITYNLNQRRQVASEESEPFIREEARREAAEYAKMS